MAAPADGPPRKEPLPRSVKALGLTSLLNDASSEFLYPFLPAFLTGVLGASKPVLGLVEGAAEAASTLAKFAAGPLAMRLRRRKPLVVIGYGAAALSRPLLALVPTWIPALALRVGDRLGKGLRGPPRDALVAAVTPAGQRGRAFGFRAAMDHLGAVLGALLAAAAAALVLPAAGDGERALRLLVLLGSVPAMFSVLVVLRGVREVPPASGRSAGEEARPEGGGRLLGGFRRYLAAVAVFSLGNSSDAFLLLRAESLGIPLASLPLLWAAHHGVKPALAWFAGDWSDRVGRKGVILLGWGVYAAVYAGFALMESATAVVLLFLAYGVYHGFAEGVEKALVADLVPEADRDRAYARFAGVTGAAALPASLGAGFLWAGMGASWALGAGALLAALAAGILLVAVPGGTGGVRTGR